MSPHHPNHSMVAILIMTCCDLEMLCISSNIMNSLSFPIDVHANLVAFHALVSVKTVIYTDTLVP